MKINCIAIDDEPLALELIENYIKKIPYLNLLGTYDSSGMALTKLNELNVDLIFSDINMPDINGLQLIRSLENAPKVIFTTAYDSFAIQGFELNAIDYLLKPFTFERFLQAAEKMHDRALKSLHSNQESKDKYIFIKTEHNIVKVMLDDIDFVEGYKDYLKIYTSELKPLLTLKSMISMEEILQNKGFIRIHKSYIISINKIHSLRNRKVKIRDKWLPISDSYKDRFQAEVLEGKL